MKRTNTKQLVSKRKKRTYRKKKDTVDQKIKRALKINTNRQLNIFSEFVALDQDIPYNVNNGAVFVSNSLESLPTGTSPQQRIGNRIDLVGIRINYRIYFDGCKVAPDLRTGLDFQTANVKIVMLQLNEINGGAGLYGWQSIKADYLSNGNVVSEQNTIMDSGNNNSNRKRWNIIWEKGFRLQQCNGFTLSATGTYQPCSPMYPREIKGTKWIPAKN